MTNKATNVRINNRKRKIIKQEIIDAFHVDMVTGGPHPKGGCAKGVKKYHIRKNGTAKENPEFKRIKQLPEAIIKTKAKFDLEVVSH